MIKFLFRITGIVLFIYSIIMSIVMNFNLGIVMCFLIGAFFFTIGVVKKIIGGLRFLVKLASFGIFVIVLFSGFIYLYGQNDTVTYNEDVLIILGAGIDGERVTYPLAQRLDEGIIFHEKNPNAIIVVTGGQGPQENITEALAMERYLIDRGVNKNIIIKEEQATSTYENFMYSKIILDKLFENNYTVGFATTDYHIFRASQIAAEVGYETTHVNAKSQNFSIPMNYSREFLAVIKYYVFKN